MMQGIDIYASYNVRYGYMQAIMSDICVCKVSCEVLVYVKDI